MTYRDMTQYINLNGFDAIQDEIVSALAQFQVIENNANKAYIVWQERTENVPLLSLIPKTKQWIIDEFKREMYAHVEKITFIVFDSNNTPWDQMDLMDEFVYVRPTLEHVLTVDGTVVDTRAASWDKSSTAKEDRGVSYAILFEGIYTDYFRDKIKNV